jgi:hypothetical protein
MLLSAHSQGKTCLKKAEKTSDLVLWAFVLRESGF